MSYENIPIATHINNSFYNESNSNSDTIEIVLHNQTDQPNIAIPISDTHGSAEIFANSLDYYKIYKYCIIIPFIGICTFIVIYCL